MAKTKKCYCCEKRKNINDGYYFKYFSVYFFICSNCNLIYNIV